MIKFKIFEANDTLLIDLAEKSFSDISKTNISLYILDACIRSNIDLERVIGVVEKNFISNVFRIQINVHSLVIALIEMHPNKDRIIQLVAMICKNVSDSVLCEGPSDYINYMLAYRFPITSEFKELVISVCLRDNSDHPSILSRIPFQLLKKGEVLPEVIQRKIYELVEFGIHKKRLEKRLGVDSKKYNINIANFFLNLLNYDHPMTPILEKAFIKAFESNPDFEKDFFISTNSTGHLKIVESDLCKVIMLLPLQYAFQFLTRIITYRGRNFHSIFTVKEFATKFINDPRHKKDAHKLLSLIREQISSLSKM